MNFRESLKSARDFVQREGGHIAPLSLSEEELNPAAQDDLSYQAHALEPTRSCYSVNYLSPDDSGSSEFSFFEDGRQRTVHIGFIHVEYGTHSAMIPVHYFVVAAVILQREDHQLKLWTQPEMQHGILVDRSLVPNQAILGEFENAGLVVVDTEGKGGDYYKLRSRSLQKAKALRLDIEDRLIRRWRTSKEATKGFLVVDGTLMNFRDEENVRQCVGVSKSFGTRYFGVTENNRILQMREFKRSWTFRFHDPEEDTRMGRRERVSWYLRLRTRTAADPEFGLIRVEISHSYADKAAEFAERFSRSLLSERLPTSYPTARWDKHLYPIRECENYLSSVIPSITTITASMKGALL